MSAPVAATARRPRGASIVDSAVAVYGVPRPLARALAWFPLVVTLAFAVLLAIPATHARAAGMLKEDRLVENLTVVAYLAAAGLGVAIAARRARRRDARAALGAAALGAVCFVLGMEEISWGERWLHFRVPDLVFRSNVQHEMNLHNLEPIHDLNWWFPLVVAVLAAVAIAGHTRPRGDRAGVPSLLLPWCAVVAAVAGYTNATDWFPVDLRLDTLVAMLTELVEMLVAFGFAIGLGLALRRDARAAPARGGP